MIVLVPSFSTCLYRPQNPVSVRLSTQVTVMIKQDLPLIFYTILANIATSNLEYCMSD